MGKGRKPCCVKSEVKRGVWSLEEDQKLIDYVQRNGHVNWRTLPQRAGLQRCGKSCRLRWINYLNPNVKLGNFTKEEEDTIIKLQEDMGNKWATIATYLPGRTDNEIKNLWNTHLKKRLYKDDTNSTTNGPNRPPFSAASTSSSTTTIECSRGGRKGKYFGIGNVMNGMDEKSKKPRQEEAQNPQFFNQFVFSNMGMREMPTFPSNNSILTHQQVLDFPDPGFDEAMFMSNLLGEVNQPLNTTTIAQENVLEKPILDPNKDIWKIIEEMEPSELQHQIDEAATQSAEEKWMTYLENQLDLDDC